MIAEKNSAESNVIMFKNEQKWYPLQLLAPTNLMNFIKIGLQVQGPYPFYKFLLSVPTNVLFLFHLFYNLFHCQNNSINFQGTYICTLSLRPIHVYCCILNE